jgi:arginase family enzyme
MNLRTYFEPLSTDNVRYVKDDFMPSLGQNITAYWQDTDFPDLSNTRLVLVGAPDDRSSVANHSRAGHAADAVRSKLYSLAMPCDDFACVDLGNLVPGDTTDDTIFALSEILADLLEKDITVLVLGGSQALTMANYKAYATLRRIVNITSIDSRFDIEEKAEVDSRSWLYHIILQQPNYLFNFANLGYQSYLCGNKYIHLIDDLQFDAIRLGEVQANGMIGAEPMLRWSDMVSVDLGAVRQSDAPGNANVSPHGFYGEQLCQLMRFAGMSDKVSSLGIYELNTDLDRNDQTAALAAQALWHFIEGFFGRMGDIPYRDREDYRRYIVPLSNGQQEITFYKSKKSDRWWFEVPCETEENRERYQRQLMIPCTYDDYQQALQDELPERWMRLLQRVN